MSQPELFYVDRSRVGGWKVIMKIISLGQIVVGLVGRIARMSSIRAQPIY